MKSNLEKRLLSIPGVSALNFKDEQLFRIAFPKDSVQYVRSWLYILRSSHSLKGQLGYKCITKDLVAVIAYRNETMYVIPIADSTNGVALKHLCQNIFQKTACRVLIKKFHEDYYQQITTRSLSRITEELLEDDTYPEALLQLQRLFISSKGEINPVATKLIRKIKRF